MISYIFSFTKKKRINSDQASYSLVREILCVVCISMVEINVLPASSSAFLFCRLLKIIFFVVFNPDVALTSDFIGGFCGETEEDHRDTLSLIEQVKYSFVFCFPYSMREVRIFFQSVHSNMPPCLKCNNIRVFPK